MDILVKRIKELRAQQGLTQQQLAFDTGLSVSGIQSIEIGRAKPNVETLSKLAERFGVTTDYLIGRTDDPSTSDGPIIKGHMKGLAFRLLAVAERVSPEDVSKFKELTDSIADDDTASNKDDGDKVEAMLEIIEKKLGIPTPKK